MEDYKIEIRFYNIYKLNKHVKYDLIISWLRLFACFWLIRAYGLMRIN